MIYQWLLTTSALCDISPINWSRDEPRWAGFLCMLIPFQGSHRLSPSFPFSMKGVNCTLGKAWLNKQLLESGYPGKQRQAHPQLLRLEEPSPEWKRLDIKNKISHKETFKFNVYGFSITHDKGLSINWVLWKHFKTLGSIMILCLWYHSLQDELLARTSSSC